MAFLHNFLYTTRMLILLPEEKCKIGQKSCEKRRTLNYERGLFLGRGQTPAESFADVFCSFIDRSEYNYDSLHAEDLESKALGLAASTAVTIWDGVGTL